MKRKFRVIIPAGGRSSRSGLSYPKTLYELKGVPILMRILDKVSEYDPKPIIIINPLHEDLFVDTLSKFKRQGLLVFQNEPRGMGHAVLQADDCINNNDHVILMWSDIPLMSELTIRHLVNCHSVSENDFSLVTSIGPNCYTIVERKKGELLSVKETRAMGIQPPEYGEREIGLFAFKKQLVFELLKQNEDEFYEAGKKEHGFLDVVERLVMAGAKVEGYPVAVATDLLSFNTPEDLKQIELVMASGNSE